MRTHLSLLLLVPIAVLALAAAGCGGGDDSGTVPTDAVAIVGDQTITKAQFETLMDQAERGYKQQKRPFPKQGTPEYEQLKQQAVQVLVQRSQFDQKAGDLDITITDDQVDARLQQIIKETFDGSESKYQQQLKEQGLTEDQIREDIEAQLLSEAIFKDVTADAKVTDEQVRQYYDQNRAQYEVGESRDIRHILIACGSSAATTGSKPKSCDDAKAEAQDLYDQLQNGADFATLAKQNSDDPGSASKGGKLTITRGQTVAAFDQTAFLLGKGKISAPLKTEFGYHIIEPLSDVREKKTTPYAQVKESIRQQLLQQEKNKVMNTWLEDTKEEFNIRYQVGYAPQATQS